MERRDQILPFKTLHICSKMIPAHQMEMVGFRLGLTQKDMDIIAYELCHYYPSTTPSDKMLLILATWKTNLPDKCTLRNLEQVLQQMQLCGIMDNLKQTLKDDMITPTPRNNKQSDKSPVGTLSYGQLRICSNLIGLQSIDRVGRQLKLTCNDLAEIDYKLQTSPAINTSSEKKQLVLETWKERYPDRCTVQELAQCLRSLCLNKTADDVLRSLAQNSVEHSLLEQDEKCLNKTVIDENLLSELSKIIGGKQYKNLGFELGFTRGELENIQYQCMMVKEPIHDYTSAVLREWKKRNCNGAVLGLLYKALRKMSTKDIADSIYQFVSDSC